MCVITSAEKQRLRKIPAPPFGAADSKQLTPPASTARAGSVQFVITPQQTDLQGPRQQF